MRDGTKDLKRLEIGRTANRTRGSSPGVKPPATDRADKGAPVIGREPKDSTPRVLAVANPDQVAQPSRDFNAIAVRVASEALIQFGDACSSERSSAVANLIVGGGGCIDNHNHYMRAGRRRRNVDCHDVRRLWLVALTGSSQRRQPGGETRRPPPMQPDGHSVSHCDSGDQCPLAVTMGQQPTPGSPACMRKRV